MITLLNVIHISTIVLLVIAVLLQSGKGAEVSATFGGSSQTVFGSSGGANFFQKLTYTLAAIFMCTSLALTILPGKTKKSVFEGYSAPAPTNTAPTNTAPTNAAPTNTGATTDATTPAAATNANATGTTATETKANPEKKN